MADIYTTGDGNQRQYARRDDGVWFVRDKRTDAPGWQKWRVFGRSVPIGLWKTGQNARIPKIKNTRPHDLAWYIVDDLK